MLNLSFLFSDNIAGYGFDLDLPKIREAHVHDRYLLYQAMSEWFLKWKRDLPWRKTKDPYKIWVSEIILQQTRVSFAIEYYQKFITAFPTVKSLAQAKEEEVLKYWEGLGYYRRAKNLHKGAKYLWEHYRGELPRDYKSLRLVPGIGAYTAGAILSFAFDIAVPAIDGNAVRVLSRLLEKPWSLEQEKHRKEASRWVEEFFLHLQNKETLFTGQGKRDESATAKCKNPTTSVFTSALFFEEPRENVQDEVGKMSSSFSPALWNEALIELGALLCLPKQSKCELCPLQNYCLAYQNNSQAYYPLAKIKKDLPVEAYLVLGVYTEGGELLLEQRGKGLLEGLWQFPFLPYTSEKKKEKIITSLQKKIPGPYKVLAQKEHIFSHKKWKLTFIEIPLKNEVKTEFQAYIKKIQKKEMQDIKKAKHSLKKKFSSVETEGEMLPEENISQFVNVKTLADLTFSAALFGWRDYIKKKLAKD